MFKAISGYQLLPPVMCNHQEGCARRVRDSLLHDSGLGAAATISARVAGRAAPAGGRRARRACTGICLHACLLLRGGAQRAGALHALGFACCLAAWLLMHSLDPPRD